MKALTFIHTLISILIGNHTLLQAIFSLIKLIQRRLRCLRSEIRTFSFLWLSSWRVVFLLFCQSTSPRPSQGQIRQLCIHRQHHIQNRCKGQPEHLPFWLQLYAVCPMKCNEIFFFSPKYFYTIKYLFFEDCIFTMKENSYKVFK